MSDRRALDLAVIIVNYNSATLLRTCLESLYRHPLRLGSMAVWVVDNASGDESVQLVREEFPHVQLISNENNLGFAAANNQAIECTQSGHVLLLNPDTEMHDSTLDQMLQFMDDTPDAGAMGAQLINLGCFSFFEVFVTVPDQAYHTDVARDIFLFLTNRDGRKPSSSN